MTKKQVKQALASVIRDAVLTGKEKGLKVEKIIQSMNEYKINRTQIKATIRSGNASFTLKNDNTEVFTESKTYKAIEKICEWIDTNLPKPTKK